MAINFPVAILPQKPVATSGIFSLIGVDGSGALVRGARGVFNALNYNVKGDGTTDDAPVIQALIDAVGVAGGGCIYFPKPSSKYKCNSTIDISYNNIHILADNKTAVIFDFAGQSSGPGFRVGPGFDGILSSFSILNAYGNCLEVATSGSTGQQTNGANGELRNLALKGSRNGVGFYGSNFFMHVMENIRAQSNALGGFLMDGYSTTLEISRCWATANSGDGWNIKNVTYSGMHQCGADNNAGFGYVLQDAHLGMHFCGAENNDKSALSLVYNSGSSSLIKGLTLFLDGFLTITNNAGHHSSMGHLLTLSGSPASTLAGLVRLTGWREGGSPFGNAAAGAGAFKIISPADQNYSALTFDTASAGFSRVSDGATDVASLLPVNITGANTKIGKLGPKMANSLASYGGLVVIHATQNNRGSSSRGAVYAFTVVSASGSLTDLDLAASSGYTAGANVADASFTYTLDFTTGELRASPVGSTATGNWYFDVAVIGDLSFVPA